MRSLCAGQRVESSSGEMELGFGNDRRPADRHRGRGSQNAGADGEIGDGVMLSGIARNDAALASMLKFSSKPATTPPSIDR